MGKVNTIAEYAYRPRQREAVGIEVVGLLDEGRYQEAYNLAVRHERPKLVAIVELQAARDGVQIKRRAPEAGGVK
jgi:hypothetical protein